MSYGIQIFNKDDVDIVAGSSNTHMLDYFQILEGGSKTYPVEEGERLVASVVIMSQGGSWPSCYECKVSGNTVSWATLDPGPNLMAMIVTKETI